MTHEEDQWAMIQRTVDSLPLSEKVRDLAKEKLRMPCETIYHALLRSPFHLALCVGCGQAVISQQSGQAICIDCYQSKEGQ